jgi:hypothetical protein
MTAPTNLYQAPSLRGNREDLIDKIYNTAADETPVTNSYGKSDATGALHEWQTDTLAAANGANAAIDGSDTVLEAQTPTNRIGNYPQIFTKRPGTSRRANLIKKAGRKSEQAYLRAKAMVELKRDIEAMVLSAAAAVAPTTTVAPRSAGLGVQAAVNPLHGAGGSTTAWTSGAPTTAPVAGTARAFTEALLKTALQNIFNATGKAAPRALMSASHKSIFSGFTGIGQTNRVDIGRKKQAQVVGGADIYVSDFGNVEAVPHYIMSGATNVFLDNPEYADLAFLDGFKTAPLGKSGDSERELVTVDVCLALRAPNTFAKIADLTA